MQAAYCTIITKSHLHYAIALHKSITRLQADNKLHVVVVDFDPDKVATEQPHPGIYFISIQALCHSGAGNKIQLKYAANNIDFFRWSLKPILLTHLLDNGFQMAFFLDPDLYFFSDFSFLAEHLQENAVLLTPHWRALRPEVDEPNFACLQTSGLFNAGFIGVSQAGRPAMEWWANACLYRCEKRPEEGLFVDQAYLDILPAYFEGVAIERHRGCNVANWNRVECEREVRNDGSIGIRGGWDIVFIHFTNSTIQGIRTGEDPLLKGHLAEYLSDLEESRNLVGRVAPDWAGALKSPPADTPHSRPVSCAVSSTPHTPALHASTMDVFLVRAGIKKALLSVLPMLHGTVLDVGCGQKPYKDMIMATPSRATRYIGLDLENNPIHQNQPDLLWEEGRIPLGDDSVDCAVCTEVLEHCPDPDSVLREVARVLKPGGLLFFTVPFLWPLHEVPYDQYRYTPFALERHLANSGFHQVELKALGGWDASLAQMMGLWVRRRPMRQWLRTALSWLLLPVYRLLLHADARQRASFTESSMITGLYGTARKRGA